jgi:flagella basal body P-ring formation protein FlgA
MRMLPATLLAVLLVQLAAPAWCAPARTVLALEPAALAAGARVTLADVAQVRAGARPAAGALAAIDLAAAPLPGYTLRLAREEIARTLRARALPYELAPEGPDAVRIERRSQPFDTAQLVQLAEQALRVLAQGEGSRLELALAAPLPDMALPAGAVGLRARPPALQALRQRRPTVWIDVTVDGAFFRSVPVGFEQHAWRSALVAVRDLDAGPAPACTDFEARDTDLAALPGPAVEDCAGVQGRLVRRIARGEPLLQAHLKNSAAVAQGDTVTLQYAAGAILLESQGVALADGAVGQRIDVRPSGALQAVRAEVTSAGIVRINGK